MDFKIQVEEPMTEKRPCWFKRLKTSKRVVIITITVYRITSYQCTYLEEIRSIFDQIMHIIYHPIVQLPEKPSTPKTIGE